MGAESVLCVELSGAEKHDSQMAEPMVTLLNTQDIERFVADTRLSASSFLMSRLKRALRCDDDSSQTCPTALTIQ
jgi:hypothetical protein